jgi:hypothetical protein
VWEGRSCSGVRETQPAWMEGGGSGVVVVGAPPPPAHAIYTLGQGTGKATTVPCSLFLQVFSLLRLSSATSSIFILYIRHLQSPLKDSTLYISFLSNNVL